MMEMGTEMIALHLLIIKYKMVRTNPVLQSLLLKLLKNRLTRNVYQFDNAFLDFWWNVMPAVEYSINILCNTTYGRGQRQ